MGNSPFEWFKFGIRNSEFGIVGRRAERDAPKESFGRVLLKEQGFSQIRAMMFRGEKRFSFAGFPRDHNSKYCIPNCDAPKDTFGRILKKDQGFSQIRAMMFRGEKRFSFAGFPRDHNSEFLIPNSEL